MCATVLRKVREILTFSSGLTQKESTPNFDFKVTERFTDKVKKSCLTMKFYGLSFTDFEFYVCMVCWVLRIPILDRKFKCREASFITWV